jgi:hypothetical protein
MRFRRYTRWHERGDPPLELPQPKEEPKRRRREPTPPNPFPPGLLADFAIKEFITLGFDRGYTARKTKTFLKRKGYEVELRFIAGMRMRIRSSRD